MADAGRHDEALPAVALDGHAEALHQPDRDVDVGFEISSPSTSTTILPSFAFTSGSVISNAVRNWLDTSPRADRRVDGNAAGDPQRRVAFVQLVVDLRADLPQTVDGSPIGRSCMRGTPCTR